MAAAVSGAEEEGVMAAKSPTDGRAPESGMDPGTATVAASAGGGTGGGGESEDEEEENVYEVEKILDMKTEDDSSGMTLVMLAATGSHDNILRLLIWKGAKVNCRQKNGTTALIHAAEKANPSGRRDHQGIL